MAFGEFPDPVEQREQVASQIQRWEARYDKRPTKLLELQIAALHRLLGRLDDMIDRTSATGGKQSSGKCQA